MTTTHKTHLEPTRRSTVSSQTHNGSSSVKTSIKAADAPSSDFGKTLENLMGTHKAGSKVNEEELFAAAIGQQVKDQYGDEMYRQYKLSLQIGMTEIAPGHTGPSTERAAKLALRDLVKSDKLTVEQARSIRYAAFDVAQLDDNRGKLYDSDGGTGDSSRAVARFSTAENLISERLAFLATNNPTTPTTSTPTTPNTKLPDGNVAKSGYVRK